MMDTNHERNKFRSNAVIKVIGVGGGGGNALNTMIESGLSGVEFIAANTDVQALQANLAPIKVQLGRELTKGLGAGANPETGRNAALEDKALIQEVLAGADMVFVTCGMGGGTGTGAAPIIAQLARELGALTVGVVTKPFSFEGKKRKLQSENGIQSLRQSVDTLITIPNQRLLSIAPPDMSLPDGLKLADAVLLNAVKGISDIINIPGRVNVDFADVKTIMSEMGMALMGIGSASGLNRAAEAARAAINSPLLEDIDIEGATGILINITGSSAMTLHEISEASTLIQEAAHEDANIIFGAVIDDNLNDHIRVTVIATGFDQARVAYPENQTFAGMPSQPPASPFSGVSTQNVRSPAFSAPHAMTHQYDPRAGAQQPTPATATPPVPSQFTPPGGQQSLFNRQAAFINRGSDIPNREMPLRSAQTAPVSTMPIAAAAPVAPMPTPAEATPSQSPVFSQISSNVTMAAEAQASSSTSLVRPEEIEDFTETALKLAKELSDIEIDDSDFDTPAFMRHKNMPQI